MSEEILKLIKRNDEAIKQRENTLTDKVEEAYNRAIAAAIKEFKELENISENKKVSSQEVKRILDKTLKAFGEEFQLLVKPIQEATIESYEEGMSETGQILKVLNKEE
jgi:membrane-associated HD superfamily phosphohydrolase